MNKPGPLQNIFMIAAIVAIVVGWFTGDARLTALLTGWTLIISQFFMLFKYWRESNLFSKLTVNGKMNLSEVWPDRYSMTGPKLFSHYYAWGYHMWAPVVVIPTLYRFWVI